MYRHIKSFELRYTDVDAYDNLKLSSLLSFLEESACLSADELGFGYADVAPKHLGFVIVNWYIELNRNIKFGDVLTLHTWPLKPRFTVFLRDFELFCGEEKVGVATARWFMINTDTFSVLPSSAFFADDAFDHYNTERSVNFSAWKIPRISDGELKYRKSVTYSDYDHYFHVNNTKYADFLMDVFIADELKDKDVHSVQITYVKQCKEGEIIDFVRQRCDGGYLIEGTVGNDLRVQMRIIFNGV